MTNRRTTSPVRLKDIARRTRLSVAAVSMALSDHPSISEPTRTRVKHACQKLGYRKTVRPPRDARDKATGLQDKRVGLYVIGRSVLTHHETAVTHTLTALLQEAEARLELGVAENDNLASQALQLGRFAAGVDVLLLTGRVTTDWLDLVADSGRPCVIYAHIPSSPSRVSRSCGHFVAPNHALAGAMAVALLRRRGHERIGFVCDRALRGLWVSNWWAGYSQAHFDADLPFHAEWTFLAGDPYRGGEQAAAAFTSLQQPPTAFVIPEPSTAALFLQTMALRQHPIDHRDVVIGKGNKAAQEYGVERCAKIHVTDDRLAAALFDTIRRATHGAALPRVDTLLEPDCFEDDQTDTDNIT